MKIAIACPTPNLVPISFTYNLIDLLSYTRNAIPDVEMYFLYRTGVRTDKNRNVLLNMILEEQPGTDYVLWLDTDMLYPHDMIERYLEHDFDVIGGLYFKRTEPFDPVAYIDNPDKKALHPFMSLNPDKLPENTVLEVDGLGYGGLMVDMNVYKAMGDDKWIEYGKGFYLPYINREGHTHDLEFCRRVKKHGFSVKLHTGVQPGHIAETVVTVDNWRRANKEEVTTIA